MHITQLLTAVNNINGASFVGLDTLTEVKLKGGKSNPMQGFITKKTLDSQVMAFQNKNVNGYEAMVKRRLISEGKDPDTFELGPRTWGVRIPNLPIVEHEKDSIVNYYLEVIFLRAGRSMYFHNGQHINKADIIGLEDNSPGEQGNLTNKVIIRSYKSDSIVEIRIDGKVFQ